MKRTNQKTTTIDSKDKKRSKVIAIRIYGDDIEIAEWLTKHANLALAATTGMRVSYEKLKPAHAQILLATRKVLAANPGELKIHT